MKDNVGVIGIDNFYLSKKYEESLSDEVKKSRGIYYTPKVIVDYIIKKIIKNHDIIKNPYPKVLDISCGCGNFLLKAYDALYYLFENNIYKLKEVYKDNYWSIDNIHRHILEHCIFGVDIDNNAIQILKNSLMDKDINLSSTKEKTYKLNIYCDDGLKKSWDFKFDYIIGNPPYVGHKLLDKSYKKYLLKEYNQVYKDKSDLYFCFYKRSIDLLKDTGTISMITPRYFLQSLSGKHLRSFIKDNTYINEIVDFLGADIFKNVGIASCILTLNKKQFKYKRDIQIYKINNENIKINEIEDLSQFLDTKSFNKFKLNQNLLDDNWIIADNEDIKFYNKIESNCKYSLEEITNSFQGIITGCDKAFILDNDDERIKYISNDILKKWIKNKNIKKYIVEDTKFNLIYSNDMDNEENYTDIINKCIQPYKLKLENRRECKNNSRKWYELQWGREKSLFERQKIMYPYKSKNNRFAIDYKNSYCSADVYSFFIKDKYSKEFSNEYLVGILNSKVYDRYFKITAKHMGKEIYDYYPNKVMKIKIFKDYNYKKIEDKSKKILQILKNTNSQNEKICKLEDEINLLIKESLHL